MIRNVPRGIRYLVGIDEAGRGPLAGPIYIGAVMVPLPLDLSPFVGVRDSKQLTLKAREEWLSLLRLGRRHGELSFAHAYSPASLIDRRGLVGAVEKAVARALKRLAAPPNRTFVFLDGLLTAPSEFRFQQTIIGGDEQEPLIALASIVAKVRRDRYMIRVAEHFGEYGFELHKGYGTALHYKRLHLHGPCTLHRRSFLRNIDGESNE